MALGAQTIRAFPVVAAVLVVACTRGAQPESEPRPTATLASGTASDDDGESAEPSNAEPTSGAANEGPQAESGPVDPPPAEAPFDPSPAPTAPGTTSAARALLEKLGLPGRFVVGLGNDAYGGGGAASVAAYALGPRVDVHYMYLSGFEWPTWTSVRGDYVRTHAEAAAAHGVVPMFTLYQAAAWGEAALGSFASTSFMTSYWAGARLAFEKLGAFGKPAIMHLEPDFWGYTQQRYGDDPAAVKVVVGALVPECKDLPDDVGGFGKCLVRLSHAIAPKVAIGLQASTFGASTAAKVGAYLAKVGGAESDLVVVETLDRDAGCFEVGTDPNCKRTGTFTWDESNTTHPSFHDHLAWAKTIHATTGKPLLWWQMPMGVPSASSGSAGRYRDNRVRYLFAHPDEFVAAGGIGAVFGTGAPNQTTPLTDGGQFAGALARYLTAPIAIP